MTGYMDSDRLIPGRPIYAVELRERGDGAEVAIVRIPPESIPAGAPEDVWTNLFANLEAARMVMQVMMARPDRWAFWARTADMLGADVLTGLIEAEFIEASMAGVREAEEARRDAERLERAARDARVVHAYLILAGAPRIVASCGARPFLILMLGTTLEARRVWDWVRWQTNSLQDWFLLARAHGAAALERLILESMLAEERRVKAAGLSAGGRRPLRHWRPTGATGRETLDGFEVDGTGDDDE